jgi:hypothetical protein
MRRSKFRGHESSGKLQLSLANYKFSAFRPISSVNHDELFCMLIEIATTVNTT